MTGDNRFLVPFGLAVVALVFVAAATGPVGLGDSGRELLLTAALAVYLAAGVVFLVRPAKTPVTVALLVLPAGAAIVIRLADPAGPVIGLFLVAAFAPLRLPLRPAAAPPVSSALSWSSVR